MRLVKYIQELIKPILKKLFIYKYLCLMMQSCVKCPYAISIELTNRCNLKCRMCLVQIFGLNLIKGGFEVIP